MMSTPARALLPCLIACALTGALHAETPATELPAVKVTGTLRNQAAAREAARLARVPGGTNLIEPQHQPRLATLRDALDYQPGLVVQDFFGGIDQPRLNIRGSGIQSNPLSRGVLLLEDGLPLNEADGSFVIGLLEPRNAAAIGVRRGANATSPGATTLGGELDFHPLTATDEHGRFGMETGSDGRRAVQAALGVQGQTLDAHLAASRDRYDGYRHHADGERSSVQANAGLRLGGVENRAYLDWTELAFHIPFVLPKTRVASDPRGVMGDGDTPQDTLLNVYRRDPRRDTRQLRLADRAAWGGETLRQSAGAYWQDTDDLFNNQTNYAVIHGRTWGAQWRLDGRAGEAFGYRLGLETSRGDMNRAFYATSPQDGRRLQRFGDFALRARNRNAVAGVDWQPALGWTLLAETKWSDVERDARGRTGGGALDQHWRYATPRLGAIWGFAPRQRLYANLSRSHEAPTFWEIVSATVSPLAPAAASAELIRLNVQRATTLELGGEGQLAWGTGGRLHWSVSAYRSRVQDELIATTDAYGVKVGTYNYAGGTRHQGIEAGLDGHLLLAAGGALDYRLSWTTSDFRFRSGVYAGNRVAGVPRQVIGAELLYAAGHWRLGPNLHWVPVATPIDHANTPGEHQDPYALLGLRIEYQGAGWRAWLLGENLTDRRYASSYVISNRVTAGQPAYLPGNGRGVSAGFDYRF
jgi:iron complex outermembrane receptor protein